MYLKQIDWAGGTGDDGNRHARKVPAFPLRDKKDIPKVEETSGHIKVGVGVVVPVPAHAPRVTGAQFGNGQAHTGSTTSV
jgi:hypothetical protein